MHLKRDFQKWIDRGGVAEAIGQAGLKAVGALFALWWDFRQRKLTRAALQTGLDPIARDLPAALERGCGGANGTAATFCANVLTLEPTLWLFAAIEGVEPTNNHTERISRFGVPWRKNAFGSYREAGCRFNERMLTVVQTLRLQRRPVLDYLLRAIVAQRSGAPAPKLLSPAGN